MSDYSRPLGDTVKKARLEQGLTQAQLAEQINIDVRTIINIENYKGNPKMEVLFPLIRALKIDAREIFNPEMERQAPAIRRLRFLIEECTEPEAKTMISVVTSVLSALREKNSKKIE